MKFLTLVFCFFTINLCFSLETKKRNFDSETTVLAKEIVEAIEKSSRTLLGPQGKVIELDISGKIISDKDPKISFPISLNYQIEALDGERYKVYIALISKNDQNKPERVYTLKEIQLEKQEEESELFYDVNKFRVAEVELFDEIDLLIGNKLTLLYGISVGIEMRHYKFEASLVNSPDQELNQIILAGLSIKPGVGTKVKLSEKSHFYIKGFSFIGREDQLPGVTFLNNNYEANGEEYYVQFETGYVYELAEDRSLRFFYRSKKMNASTSFDINNIDHSPDSELFGLEDYNRIGFEYNF